MEKRQKLIETLYFAVSNRASTPHGLRKLFGQISHLNGISQTHTKHPSILCECERYGTSHVIGLRKRAISFSRKLEPNRRKRDTKMPSRFRNGNIYRRAGNCWITSNIHILHSTFHIPQFNEAQCSTLYHGHPIRTNTRLKYALNRYYEFHCI